MHPIARFESRQAVDQKELSGRMPIVQRFVKRSDPSPKFKEIVEKSEGEEYIRAKTFTDTLDCFRRLSELSSHASDIFAELALLSTDINHRIGSLTARTAKLQVSLPKLVVDASAFKINDDEYQHHRQMLQNPESEHLVDHTTMSHSMATRLDELKPRIQFGALDEYLSYFAMGTKPTTIAQRYSNPEYFLNQWCAAQVQRMKLLEKEKRQQKVDKQARKKQRKVDEAAEEQHQRKPGRRSSVNWQERYMVDGKAVHRKSLTEAGTTKGKRLSVLNAMPVRKAEPDTQDAEADEEEVSEKGSPDKVPPLVKRPSHLTAGASTKSSPTVRYSAVYPSKSTKTFSEGQPMDEASARDDASSEAGSTSAQSTSPPAAASQSKPPPPPPAAAAVPAKAFSGLSLAANVPGKVPPPPAPSAATTSSNKAATPPPPPPPAATSSTTTPPPPPPPASTTTTATTSTAPPPPPPAAPSAPSTKSADDSESTSSSSNAAAAEPAAAATAATSAAAEGETTPDADSDSDEENGDASGAPAASVPSPVYAPPTSSYLDEINCASVPEYTSIKVNPVRPPPPPPPPGPPKDPASADAAKTLLKPRPPSTEESSPRTGQHTQRAASLRARLSFGAARTASTDSISSQLGSFAFMMSSGGDVGGSAVAMGSYADEEEEIDHFAAVNSEMSSLSKPSPPPPPPPPPAAAAQQPTPGGNSPARVSFLDAIKQGAGSSLRKVEEPSPRVSTGPRESLLDAIKLGTGKLRKVSAEEQAAAQEEKKRSGSSLGGFGASSVAAILERRKFLMADASSDSDSDHNDGDWA